MAEDSAMRANPAFSPQILLDLVDRRAARALWVGDEEVCTGREFGEAVRAAAREIAPPKAAP